jgi:DNA repair protein SbcC/Rad50
MIPLKLELKNFLSYGDTLQTIDFSNHTLICLSGKNGNGKSALLDAITWAVWGQARKIGGTSKADEGLLRLGQTRMMVVLTFMLNNKTYRVRREFAKTHGKPFAALDFEVLDEEGSFFRSLTDKTIRATQDVIERTINLDFDTFVNSAFLRQGQSNEFSKKTAKERKQILANILGLGTYDVLQQHANAEAKKLEQQQTSLRQVIAHLETDIGQESILREALQEIIKTLDVVNN